MLLLCALIVGMSSAWADEVAYKTALFGSSYNSGGISSYIDTWTATNNGFTVSLTNFNNNNNQWSVVKCGRKNYESVATISTSAAIDKAISKVVVTIDAITANSVNSIKLYTSSDNSNWTEAGSYTKATGAQTVTLSSPTANLYYQLKFDCASGSSNGLVTVSKVEYYQATADPGKTDPTLSFPEESYNATLGQTFTAPTLTTDPTGLSVTYSSSNPAVAEVDESNGAITLVGPGETAITASFAGNESYNSASASYTLNVIDGRAETTITISDTGITNTDVAAGTAAGSLSATVSAGGSAISGATVTWSGDNAAVATINASTGAVTLVAAGIVTFTATYDGDNTNYKGSSQTITLTITDSNNKTIWSEDFSRYSANDVPSGGTYSYACTGSGTKIYDANLAGGTSPELLVAKNGGTFTAVVPLNNASGNLKLTYKTNAKPLKVSTTTNSIRIQNAEDDGSISFNTFGEHTVTFTDVTTSMTSITITFTATSGDNVRLDDIQLVGHSEAVAVEAPTFSVNPGTYYTAQSVELNCATDGATIYYTTNGSEPSSSSTQYNGAISVTATTTIKAIAIKDGISSTVSTGTYTISEKNDVVFNITNKTLAYGETYTVTKGTSNGRDVITDGTITLSSDNDAVTSIDGLKITAEAVGTAIITINAAEGDTYKPGSTTFTVTVTAPEGQTTAAEVPSLFNETFDKCDGNGGRDGTFTGNVGTSTTTGKLDEEWETIGSNGAFHCIKLGTGNASGTVTTSNIALTGNGTLTFSAAGWGDSNTNTVTVSATGATLDGDTEVTLDASTWKSYTVNITEATGVVAITFSMKRGFLDDVKVIEEGATAEPITVKLNSSGYATFCSKYPLDFTNASGYTAWQITDISDENVITFEKITRSIKGGQGILLKGTAGETITLTSANSENVLSKNYLEGTLAPTYIAAGKYYGLSGNTFVKVNAGTVPAGKALLSADWITETIGAPSFSFVFNDGETTSIGESIMLNSDNTTNQWYDLSGRKLNSMPTTKGIYILNGRKVVVK